jgi:Ca-activated chloride channel family protein
VRRMALAVLAAAAAAAWAGAAGPAVAAVNVKIASPQPDQPVFGEVLFEVHVAGNEPIDRVEFIVNGEPVGVAHKPPFRVVPKVGDDNIQREFRAVAYGKSGAMAFDRVVTLPVRIDDKMNVRLQQLYATVSRDGLRDLQLAEGDFHVLDNGVEQKIVTFGRGDLPLTAVLLLDTSESMQGPLLEAARRGANAFIDGMKPLDEAMLAAFSDHLVKVTPFGEDPQVLRNALAGIAAGGGTAVNDFLYMSLKLLEMRQGRRVVVLLSDGGDVNSVLPMAEVLRKARTSQALIYWLQLDGGSKHKSYSSAWRGPAANDREYKTLQKAVEESGGRIQPIERVADIEPAFRSIMKELREQYALGYYPSNLKNDGTFHHVRVKVDKWGLQVRSANGYVDY